MPVPWSLPTVRLVPAVMRGLVPVLHGPVAVHLCSTCPKIPQLLLLLLLLLLRLLVLLQCHQVSTHVLVLPRLLVQAALMAMLSCCLQVACSLCWLKRTRLCRGIFSLVLARSTCISLGSLNIKLGRLCILCGTVVGGRLLPVSFACSGLLWGFTGRLPAQGNRTGLHIAWPVLPRASWA